MKRSRRSLPRSFRENRSWYLSGLLVVLLMWVMFFDSHSVLKRVQLHLQEETLAAENERLEREIDALERELEALKSDQVIERIAREEYGMHRPGETVYRVEYDQ